MVTLKLAKNEVRAVRELLYNHGAVCTGGCVYEEMKTKKTDCIDCSL